jgi:hypothetical protein
MATTECYENSGDRACVETVTPAHVCVPENTTYNYRVKLIGNTNAYYGTGSYNSLYPVYADVSETTSVGLGFTPVSQTFNNYPSGAPSANYQEFLVQISIPDVAVDNTEANIHVNADFDGYSGGVWDTDATSGLARVQLDELPIVIREVNDPPVITNYTQTVGSNYLDVSISADDPNDSAMVAKFQLSNQSNFSSILQETTIEGYNGPNENVSFSAEYGMTVTHRFTNLNPGTYYWRGIIEERFEDGVCHNTANFLAGTNSQIIIPTQTTQVGGGSVLGTQTGPTPRPSTTGSVLGASTLSDTGSNVVIVATFAACLLFASAAYLMKKATGLLKG